MTRIDWNLITRYVSGDCTPNESSRVERWLGESPENGGAITALQEVAADGERKMSADRRAAMRAAIQRQAVDASPAAPDERVRFAPLWRWQWSAAARVAAVLAVLVVGGAAAYQALKRTSQPLLPASASRVFTTTRGQRLALRLPDGTLATLAPASILRVPPDYGATDRSVELAGEAVFTVIHDTKRPFAVHTERGIARDLGTRFVVRAYPGDSVTEVVVAEGLVSVLPVSANAADSIVLAAGERAQLAAGRPILKTSRANLDAYFAWTAGELAFRDAPLRDAIVRLSRWYDVDVQLASPAIGDRLVTATFADESAADVLPLIAASLKLRLTQAGRSYVLHAR